MSDLSKVVDKLVADYEQEQERKLASSDAQMIRAMLQGMLAGQAMQMKSSNILRIADVEMPKDEEGDYERYFVVETQSGIRVRVTVDLEA